MLARRERGDGVDLAAQLCRYVQEREWSAVDAECASWTRRRRGSDVRGCHTGRMGEPTHAGSTRVRSVVFDVGETLLDDTREWGRWADWLGVPWHTFSAVLGAVTASGRNNAETFNYFRSDFDLGAERQRREQSGFGEEITDDDLYPDVRSALAALRRAGLWVGIAGNQTAKAAGLLDQLGLPVDAIATSGEWGVAKPDSEFFSRVIAQAPGSAGEIVYVGDNPENDLYPAKTAGMRAALIRRGPWGYLWADDPRVTESADWIIDSLDELPRVLAAEG